MTEPCYSFRANLFTPERTYRIGLDALRWTSGAGEGRIGFGDVSEVRLRRQFLPGQVAVTERTMSRVQMRCRSGRRPHTVAASLRRLSHLGRSLHALRRVHQCPADAAARPQC